MSSITLHEPAEQLSDKTIEVHRAIVSLMEELEAIDWYSQRADACKDAQLQAILKHNMEEEIEHASMTLEWIRRNVDKFNEALKLYLFTTGDVTTLEEAAKEDKGGTTNRHNKGVRVTIGDMKES
jgi:ferritin-like protein